MDPCDAKFAWTLPWWDDRGRVEKKSNLVLEDTGKKYRTEYEWDVANGAVAEDQGGYTRFDRDSST
jgi:hypothetical protein